MSDTGLGGLQDFNRKLIEEYRANGGKVTGPFAKAPLLLLTTTGAKSGKERTIPIVYTRDGDRYVIIASKGGMPTNPDWYHNLVANPEVTVEVGTESYQAHATALQGDERDRLYAEQSRRYPGFAEYQRNTSRVIPVVALVRD